MKKSLQRIGMRVPLRTKSSSKTKDVQVKNTFKVLDSPTKSYSDKKDYKVIRLENGLTACLIADVNEDSSDEDSEESESDSNSEGESGSDAPSNEDISDDSDNDDGRVIKSNIKATKLAAAALCIGVGSCSDPKHIPGLAHFLEHMVFMGSEKFPQENDFDSFITKHGGSDNASTDYEVTTFYFECFEKHLFTALDKFSQFFICPLMQRDSMTREREAIESEFQIAVPSDDFRKEQLLVSLSEESSPVNSFSWGNLVTLKENISDDVLYERLHEFRKRHYSAHRMTLAVQARLPLKTLESYVVKCFSNVPNNGLPPDDFKKFSQEIFNTPKFKQLYYVKPVKDICQVDLTFPMHSLVNLYRTKPHVYVAWLLGYQGKNSLFSYLKKKVWVLSFYAGNDESGAEFNSIYATFTISMVLTQDGFDNLKSVIESVFSFVNLLKKVGPSERIFKEIQCINEISFRFEEDDSAADNVEDLSESMQIFPPKDYLTGEALMFEYDPIAITRVLNQITPDNMNIIVSSSKIPSDVTYDKLEPWFKTQYTDRKIPVDWLDCWMNAWSLPDFCLPEPNPFITTDFQILPKMKNTPEYPEKIMQTPVIELWYRKDNKFELPMCYYYYYIITPEALKSVKSSCLVSLYALLINLNLAEEGYDAELAELEYEIFSCEKGILVKIYGYNQKLDLLIDLIGKYLTNVDELLTEPIFNAVKEKFTKSLYNAFLKPSRLCKDLRLLILQEQYFSLVDKHAAIFEITYNDMKAFSKDFLKNIYIQGLVQGNVSKEAVLKATDNFLKHLSATGLEVENSPRLVVHELPLGEHCFRVRSFDKDNSNSIITNYYQCGKVEIKNYVILELILLLIEEPLFDKLRTKEQLGYKVNSILRDTFGVLGFSITVNTQANKYTTEYVDKRIENFLCCTKKLLKKLSEKKFAQAKKDLIKSKRHVDIDLEDEFSRNWSEIISCQYIFDRVKKEIKAVEELQIGEVRRWWEQHNLFSKNFTHRKLSMQIVGHISPDKEKPTQFVKNMVEGMVRQSSSSKDLIETQSFKSNKPITDDSKLQLVYLENSADITEKRTEWYFIKDVNQFRKKLKQLNSQP